MRLRAAASIVLYVERRRGRSSSDAARAGRSPTRGRRCGTRSGARRPRSARRTRRARARRAVHDHVGVRADDARDARGERGDRGVGCRCVVRRADAARRAARRCVVVEVDVRDLSAWRGRRRRCAPRRRGAGRRRGSAAERVLEGALHGAQPGLARPAAEVRAVIGDVEPDAHGPSLLPRSAPLEPEHAPRRTAGCSPTACSADARQLHAVLALAHDLARDDRVRPHDVVEHPHRKDHDVDLARRDRARDGLRARERGDARPRRPCRAP